MVIIEASKKYALEEIEKYYETLKKFIDNARKF
jgi:hypothetical protein